MLKSFKRFFATGPGSDRDLATMSEWAKRRGYSFKRARGVDGFVIDGLLEEKPWRIEWGPPHRAYIEGHELRLRMELDLPSDMQLLVLSRPLMDSLERKTFEDFTDSVQTQMGDETPEEMRWLVMFPKLNMSGLKDLRNHFGGVASVPASGLMWIEGPLANALEQASNGFLRADPPFVLMTLRGRAYLRMQLATPDPRAVASALAVFETAVSQALRIASEVATRRSERAAVHVADWHTAATTAWQGFQTTDVPLDVDEPDPPGEPRPGRPKSK
jgi:hypothetical protein